MPQLSIVIRCFNEGRHIGRLLHGVTQQTLRGVEIIIVDSGSTDGTVEVAKRYPTRTVSIKPEDFSFGHSLNVGCQTARGEFVVIASGHVYPLYKDWLEKLIMPFEDPKIALVYGKQRGTATTAFSEHQVFAKWFAEESNLHQGHPFCNNANAAIRREVWEKLPYNEELTGLEDIDWARRAIKMGFKIAYVADAQVAHVHHETAQQTYNRYRREAIALKHIFPDEHFHFGDFLRLYLTNVFSDYAHALRDSASKREWLAILRFRLMQFWGTYRGFARRTPVTSQLKRTFYYPNHGEQADKVISQHPDQDRLVDYQSGERLYREDR
jgi:glycosyltransferase involved in cell wall biosynthesis